MWLDSKGKGAGGRNFSGAGIAIFDPVKKSWEMTACPDTDFSSRNNYYHRTVLVRDHLFISDGGKISTYNPTSRRWKDLAISDGNNYELFAVNGSLYAANASMVFEVSDDGAAMHILASTRRHPAVSALDSLDWRTPPLFDGPNTPERGTPTLFAGPNKSLRASAAGEIYTWTNNDWREDFPAPQVSGQPEILPDAVLFRYAYYSPDSVSSFTYFATETKSPELLLWQRIRGYSHPEMFPRSAKEAAPPESLWKMPQGMFLPHPPSAANRSGLYLLLNHSEVQDINNDHELVQEKVVAKDGYNGELLCFARGASLPQKLLLNFDAPGGCPPSAGIDPGGIGLHPFSQPAWMFLADNALFLGLENPRSLTPFNQTVGYGYNAGIWLIPLSQIERGLVVQSEARPDHPPTNARRIPDQTKTNATP
jgi:hypothetical protein